MKSALRSHLCSGRRIYAEGGGLAYLCQQLETPEGHMRRMVGLLPAAARLSRKPYAPTPVELTLDQANWLGAAGATLRGYRNTNWRLEPLGALASFVPQTDHPDDMVGSFPLVGSLLHLNFAAQPAFLDRFFQPHRPRPCADPWTTSQ